jgi:hypothetical protein
MTNPMKVSVVEGQESDLELSGLYFAYGTDMAHDVLRGRGGHPEVVAPARLVGYHLGFYGYTETWDSGMETVVEAAATETWGVLYRMGPLDWERLDSWMGARLDGGGPYFHYPTTVVEPCGRKHMVRLYKKDILGTERLPSTEYLNLLIRGAEQNSLPAAYVDGLRRCSSKPASFPVPALGNANRVAYASSDCSVCETGSDKERPLVVLRKAAQ